MAIGPAPRPAPAAEQPVQPLPPADAARRTSLGAFAALILGNVVLAFGPWLVRLADVGPIVSGFWRLAIALPVILIVASSRQRRSPSLSRAALAIAAIGGVFFAVDLASWHTGIMRTRLANATLFGNISSFFFMAYGFLVTRTLPSRAQSLAILLAMLGTALLMGRSFELSRDHLVGDLLCLAAGIAYTGYMIAVDRLRGRLGTWATLSAATFAAAGVLLAFIGIQRAPLWPHDWTPLVALALGSQLAGQGLLIYAISSLPPMVVGLGLLTQPVVASTVGWIVYDERLGALDLVGALAIAVALMLVRRRAAG